MNTTIKSLLLMSLLFSASSSMAKDFPRPNRIYTTETTGVVRSIDIAEREAVISGFRYYFGSPVYDNVSEVRMYGVGFGSFEMLTSST